MEVVKQAWRWARSRKPAAPTGAGFTIDRHWPAVWRGCVSAGRFAGRLLLLWRDSAVRGLCSLAALGTVALFVMIWSCVISFCSAGAMLCVLLTLGAAGAAICCLGYTPGLFIVGLFGILIMWIYGNFWMTGMLLIIGGYMFSLNHARLLIFLSTAYAIYFVNIRVGWLGVFLSLNLSFISSDFLNKLLQGYDGASGGTHFEEQKESEPTVEDFSGDSEYTPPTYKTENVASHKSCETASTSKILKPHMGASSSKVVKTDTVALDEIKRIMNSSNHYEALGFPRNMHIDPEILKREYRTKARLVHPDKNMGSPIASESFKKLQCAYEVLSDLTKKNNYDDQLRKDESGKLSQNPRSNRQQDGVEYRSEESRSIECTKCSNRHIWICTNRSKGRARWCQDCSQYHPARDGDGWVEYGSSFVFSARQKVEIPRAFVCAENKIFDVSEWAICQGMVCKPNTHRPSFHVNMVGLDKTVQRSNPRYPWSLDAEMMPEDDEFDLWLQQALASGLFTDSPKRRKSWSPFKLHQRGVKPWRRSP